MIALLMLLATAPVQTVRIPVAPLETLSVEIHGTGSPVVLIPGLFGSAWGFRHVVPSLVERGYRAIVVEPLAMGSSSRPRAADYSLTAQAARIAAVLDSLGATGAVIVAHSVSSGIALRLALRRPDLVGAIVSLDGGAPESAVTASFRRAMSLAPMIRLIGGAGLIRGRVRSGLARASGDASWVTDEAIARYTAGATANVSATLLAFQRMAETREPALLAPRLGGVRCPVLLIKGGAPHESGIRETEETLMRLELPDFSVEVVDGAGHYLHEEQPQRVADAIQRVASLRAADQHTGIARPSR